LKCKHCRSVCWSNHGAHFFLIQSLAMISLFQVIIPTICCVFWIVHVDPLEIWLQHLGCAFDFQLTSLVKAIIVILYIWTVVCCTFLVLCSLSRLLLYVCIAGFWTRIGARGESECLLKMFSHCFELRMNFKCP